MSTMPEITVPETKPATEWVRGRPLQKVSPRYTHARLQGRLVGILDRWARGRGRVGTEWRFRVAPPGEPARPLVPDVAYLSYERLAREEREAAEEPLIAPDLAIEVLSPSDRWVDVAHKIAVYCSAGSSAVVVVDPKRELLTIHSSSTGRDYRRGDVLTHPAFPGLSFDVTALFEED